MKYNPIALGFTAFAALSLTVACNVDPNRIDKDVDNTILKKRCAAANALSLNTINENRLAQLGPESGTIETALTVNLIAEKGSLVMVEESETTEIINKVDAVEAQEATETTQAKEAVEAVEAYSNMIELDVKACQVDQTAKITLPTTMTKLNREIVANVVDVDKHSIQLEDEEYNYTLEVTGVEANMSDIRSNVMAEDGVNQVKLTRTNKEGEIIDVMISASLEPGSELLGLDSSVVSLINGEDNSVTIKNVRDRIKTMSGNKLDGSEGVTRLSLEKWKAVRDETLAVKEATETIEIDLGTKGQGVGVVDEEARKDAKADETEEGEE